MRATGPMKPLATSSSDDRSRFRRTLGKVMTMQVVALILLGLLQRCYAV
jgi:hypothetical protein